MRIRFIWQFLGIIILLPGWAASQNLVPNGSFETYRNCPHQDNLFDEAIPWYNPNRATPDFYHRCFDFGQLILPPHSGQGVGHLFFDQGWAEYMGIKLAKPLSVSTCYYFEMYVATDTPNKYLTETIGAYFSTRPVTGTTTERINAAPQILDTNPRSNIGVLQWQRISGFLNPKGGEQYLTIGSFNKEPPFLGFYYLFVDDVSLLPVELELGKDTTLCSRRNLLSLNGTVPGAREYHWQDGSTNPTFQVTKPGTYSVTVLTGCKTLTDSIKVDYAIDFDLGPDTTLCTSQTLTLTVPKNPASQYHWQDGSVQDTYLVSQQGQYSVRVTQDKCVATDTIQVRYIQPPRLDLGPDKELCGAENFTIKPVVAEGTFSWQDGFTDTLRTVGSSGVFRGSVRNDCATVTDSIEIDYGACDCILYAPNSFTPNGDGMNDTFSAFGCGDLTITALAIFNRWGEVIFKTASPPFQWNGYYQEEVCAQGVYAWHIQYQLSRGKKVRVDQKQGYITLIR